MSDAQIDYWNGPAGARWVAHQGVLDRSLSSFGDAALRLANAKPGEHVLDVGCGCGDSALALAQQVAPAGSVTGVDVSAAMLERARQRAGSTPNQRFLLVDAASFAPPEPSAFDLIFSRFGIMFFTDPAAALAHLRSLLRPAGRMAFVCWRAFDDNPWAKLPLDSVRSAVPDAPPFPLDDGPGPYAFADRAKLQGLLERAGFQGISIERFDADVMLAADTIDTAVEFAINAGPAARVLGGATPAAIERARRSLAEALVPHRTERGFALPGSTWLVSARAS